ncbi:hypothetical protein [Nonomuraea sp. NPDC049400]|uniref:hypothetical protein n=1 Tax=Nonomuraea sp. NPDC049400 TaxID=3364352 RepID=UPI0037880F3A
MAAGSSPAAVVKETPPRVSVWQWMPDMPVTGLREVDESLARAHPMAAVTAPAKKRSRGRAAQAVESGQDVRPVEDTGELLIWYARELETLVTGGKLTRLLMRDRPRT